MAAHPPNNTTNKCGKLTPSDTQKSAMTDEPDELLPVPKDIKALRSGFTTGTAATAAAMVATILLSQKLTPKQVEVKLPEGKMLTVQVAETHSISNDEALATIIKDAGDDPDITNRAEIGAIVRRMSKPGVIHIIGGKGVGRVTKLGLAVAPGQWAINPGPMGMLRENLTPLLSPNCPGIEVEIFVEHGEKLAQKTLNPRLGIIGGISILGTTGLVKPFSHDAYIATISSALTVAKAEGLTEIILTTGRQSEKLAQNDRPDLPDSAFVQIADFFGASLKEVQRCEFKTIGLVSFFGKAVKQAAGHFNTHAHKGEQDMDTLSQWLTADGQFIHLETQLKESITARGALDVLRANNALNLVDQVAIKTLAAARNFLDPGSKLWISIHDYDGNLLVHRKDQ